MPTDIIRERGGGGKSENATNGISTNKNGAVANYMDWKNQIHFTWIYT